MIRKDAREIYRSQDILTASPAELIVMLYDGLQKDLLLAQRAIRKQDMLGAHNNLIKAQAIVSELLNSLDMSFPISKELASLYDFVLHHLVEANMKKDEKLIGEAMEVTGELREAWKEVYASQRGHMYEGTEI